MLVPIAHGNRGFDSNTWESGKRRIALPVFHSKIQPVSEADKIALTVVFTLE